MLLRQSRDQLSCFPRSLVTLSEGQGDVETFSMHGEGKGSSGECLASAGTCFQIPLLSCTLT